MLPSSLVDVCANSSFEGSRVPFNLSIHERFFKHQATHFRERATEARFKVSANSSHVGALVVLRFA